MCYPFPIDFEVFYRTIQDDVNAKAVTIPKRERNASAALVGWYVWNSLQQNWGCF